ncbi:hypothetical protein FC62_GL000315 [Amylolactobacillus amylotrophicus DSM 20534]|uniref:Cell division protein SepF n=3 Tax=Amylolactobacillus TaxID=2767876 RepID=A0A0R1YS89_9LACO|nr:MULTISPECIES: cell division protein SepF [Amylolactobacillus]APT19105.1 cell division protein SepF [Amylolactobacillus amylophilus DSM 20533 = JCM 1125]KRK38628.1 hypothetical protein FC62_GL000315 [Amylolactobacillus amylotrophicus DSM 20534]KRM42729.1 hypothetical protein FD40_GL000524 [Amylolactobacillus amylophilus DSM 20533 = JCM 1125]GED79591.1 cell division protein SepF [Amylolactobacillus amylophilus]
MAFDKLGRFFGISDEDNTEEYDYDMGTGTEDEAGITRDNVVSIKAGNNPTSKIVLFEPRVYADAKDVATHLLNNRAIIINFARMEDQQAKRIVDFITGTVYALNGKIQRVGDKIFLATPPKFETDGKIAELVDQKDNEY